ncbi:hypothetical protein B0H34DRAFT_679342 [Crassisporium funariophilum]|nr:hypothetical protein B0H34DRAFT_679342 [Crassisporium funariophilum]
MNMRFIQRSKGPPPLRRQQCRPLPQQGSGLQGGLHALSARVSGLVSQFCKPNLGLVNNALGLVTSPVDPLPVLLVTKTTEYAPDYLGENFAQSIGGSSMPRGSYAASSSTSSLANDDPGLPPRLEPVDLGLNLESSIIITYAILSQSTDVQRLSPLQIFSTDPSYSNSPAIESEGEFTPSANAGQSGGPSLSVALWHNSDPHMPRSLSNLDDSITSISMTYAISISECLAILRRCPNLELATFSISSIGKAPMEEVNPQSLTSLSITSSINVGTLFKCLRIPSLKELELRYELNGLDHIHELQSFVKRSRCNVTKLTLIGSDFSAGPFTRFIVNVSQGLKELILGNHRNDRTTIQSIVETPRFKVTIWTTKALQYVVRNLEHELLQKGK